MAIDDTRNPLGHWRAGVSGNPAGRAPVALDDADGDEPAERFFELEVRRMLSIARAEGRLVQQWYRENKGKAPPLAIIKLAEHHSRVVLGAAEQNRKHQAQRGSTEHPHD